MDLNSVRALKQDVREVLSKSNAFVKGVKKLLPFIDATFPFAFGIRLTPTEGLYRFAIRLPHKGAWFHLLRPALSKVLKPFKDELDVQVIGRVRFNTAGFTSHPNPALRIGASVRHETGSSGTLGFFATKGDQFGIVSCNHVIARIDQGRNGDRVLGPSSIEMTLDDHYPLLKSPDVKFADCAFAAFKNGDRPADPALLDGGDKLKKTPVVATQEMSVKKIGAATQLRTGKVVVSELDGISLEVAHKLTTMFDDVIEIESDNADRRFSNAGDSGSLIYSADGHPVGLLFADSAIGGKFNNGLAFANRFAHVTTALGVELEI